MPVPSRGTLWRGGPPHLIAEDGQRHTLGWQNTRKDGPCFIVASISFMRSIKVLERFPLTADGWAHAWAALVKLDGDAAQAVAEKVQELHAAGDGPGRATVFEWLGVQVLVDDGKVYTIGSQDPAAKTNMSRLLGPLVGANAMVTDGSQAWSPGRAMFLPIAFAGLATKTKADAAVVFPDGTVHTTSLDDNFAVREAQRQVVQFNGLAGGAAAPAATEIGSDPVVRLLKLRELREAGLLAEEEYEMKRAEIIGSI